MYELFARKRQFIGIPIILFWNSLITFFNISTTQMNNTHIHENFTLSNQEQDREHCPQGLLIGHS